jgi:carboxylesterase
VPVLPGAEPFSADAGEIGVVLLHGFTSSPQGVRPWAEALARAGYSVRLPLLPGHGTTWQDLNKSTWRQWYGTAEDAYRELAQRCSAVFAAGLSFGGALALRLAEQHGDEIRGVIVVNPWVNQRHWAMPALPVLRWVVPGFPGVGGDIKKPGMTELAYEKAPLHAVASVVQFQKLLVAELGRVTQPLLLLRSAVDHVVPPATNSAAVLAGVSSADVTEIVLEDSYHVATLDNDAERIEKESLAFVSRLAGAPEPPASDVAQGAS